jgi:deoxyribodipyrimidine photo-lyase
VGIQIVWFKRDLRIEDHAPLCSAIEKGRVMPIYIFEPSVMGHADYSARQLEFIRESLLELQNQFHEIGLTLRIFHGEALEIFERLSQKFDIEGIYVHEETGNDLTFQRDLSVIKWTKAKRIGFIESPTNGVVRGLKDRNGWSKEWEHRMAQPILAIPQNAQGVTGAVARIPTAEELGFSASPMIDRQQGGIQRAHEVLDDFLTNRGYRFTGGISSPVTAFEAGSRLSPYLTWGNLSSRQVVQATRNRINSLDPGRSQWRRSLRSFDGRMHWRCHFIQKLESEPEIENHCFMRSLNGLRENDFNLDYFEAWATGQTGYPMIDACMRALTATGWLNFRMRAMITSFASYQLWLHWKPTALHAARLWVDYEPGIHYSQFQMQSGTTGINTLRIYNPTKQAQDHDPDGVFIRQWIPELAEVPTAFIHTPWLLPKPEQERSGVTIGKTYPKPIVDHLESIAKAKFKMSEFRRQSQFWAEAKAVNEKHGSRRTTNRKKREPKIPAQPALEITD